MLSYPTTTSAVHSVQNVLNALAVKRLGGTLAEINGCKTSPFSCYTGAGPSSFKSCISNRGGDLNALTWAAKEAAKCGACGVSATNCNLANPSCSKKLYFFEAVYQDDHGAFMCRGTPPHTQLYILSLDAHVFGTILIVSPPGLIFSPPAFKTYRGPFFWVILSHQFPYKILQQLPRADAGSHRGLAISRFG